MSRVFAICALIAGTALLTLQPQTLSAQGRGRGPGGRMEPTCGAQTVFRQHCNLKLPKELISGTTYSIAAQFKDLDGHWVTAQVVPGGNTTNPLPFIAR